MYRQYEILHLQRGFFFLGGGPGCAGWVAGYRTTFKVSGVLTFKSVKIEAAITFNLYYMVSIQIDSVSM